MHRSIVRVSALGLPAVLLGIALVVPGSDASAASDVPVVVQDSAGKAIFTGKGLCQACHGPDAKGTALAPNLTDAEWLNIPDGKPETIAALVKKGVPTPKKFPAPMPAMGGAQLTDAEIQAVSRYVASLSAK